MVWWKRQNARGRICRRKKNRGRGFVQCRAARNAVRPQVPSAGFWKLKRRWNSRPKRCAAWALIIPSRTPSAPTGWPTPSPREHHFGAPVVVVDFGTAVTFDVVNRAGHYVGGIIAPGLAAMTDYLHEKTALLPKIRIREVTAVVGKNTEQAMLIGAVHGYRGLVRELIAELKRELKAKHLPVIATGGYARLIAAKLPEISAVEPNLTLEGLRLTWQATPVHGHL